MLRGMMKTPMQGERFSKSAIVAYSKPRFGVLFGRRRRESPLGEISKLH